jgi:hypothetical protein
VYYGHTIVPPAPHPDVPDVHTLNKIALKDEVCLKQLHENHVCLSQIEAADH